MLFRSISGVGKYSLTVALPIISAAGVECAVLPTAVLSTHTGGFTGFTYRDLTEDIAPMAAHWKSLRVPFDAIYTGFSYPDNLSHYEILLASKGNMELLFGNGSSDFSEIINNPDFSNPGLEFNEESVKRIVHEAEKHIGKRYVFGANGPSNFDCSSFVCWTYTHSGIKNMPRTTAWGIYKNYCNPVSPSEAKAGDIIFFKGTYNSGSPISHVGIYISREIGRASCRERV